MRIMYSSFKWYVDDPLITIEQSVPTVPVVPEYSPLGRASAMRLHLSSDGDLNLNTGLDVDDDLLNNLSWGVKAMIC
jgi:hypothetical protein